MKVNGNDPAFPTTIRREAGALATEASSGGIPIRLWIATQFLAGLIGSACGVYKDCDRYGPTGGWRMSAGPKGIEDALEMADRLIKAHNETADETDE